MIESLYADEGGSFLFTTVPLPDLVNADTTAIIELVNRQSSAFESRIIAESDGNVMPPEMRIKKITGDGVVQIVFTNSMNFPSDMQVRIN